MASHETALKMIFRYLQIAKDNGLAFNPPKKLVVDCYADAYFAGLWGHEILKTLFVIGLELDLCELFPIVLYCGCQKYR